MTEEQYKNFMYALKIMAGQLHFLREGEKGIIDFPALNESTFFDVMIRNARLINHNHAGVCFTMSSYVKTDLLYSMGIIDDVYFAESYSSKELWANYVVLYKYGSEWKICDLAAHVRFIEGCYGNILSASAVMKENKEYAEALIVNEAQKLNDETNLAMTPEEYAKNYPMATWKIYLDKGHEDDLFDNVPTTTFEEFIKANSPTL